MSNLRQQYGEMAVEYVKRSLRLFKAGQTNRQIQKYDVTFTVTILKNLLIVAHQRYAPYLNEIPKREISTYHFYGVAKSVNSLGRLVSLMRHSLAHFEFEVQIDDEQQIDAIEFRNYNRGVCKIKATHLKKFVVKFGNTLLKIMKEKPPLPQRRPARRNRKPKPK